MESNLYDSCIPRGRSGDILYTRKCMQFLPGSKAVLPAAQPCGVARNRKEIVRVTVRCAAWVFAAGILASGLTGGADNNSNAASLPPHETLHYGVEWRLIPAGLARLTLHENPPAANKGWSTHLHLESTGLVSKLYKVDDQYRANYEGGFCATDTHLQSAEGKRRRETTVRFDRTSSKASYLERDLVKNSIVKQVEIVTPECVHDVLGGLYQLRTLRLQPGQSSTIRMSDGKKSSEVRVEAQEWEEVKTKAGTFKTLRYEAFLFNGVLYERPAKVHIWVSEDSKRLPVQIKLKLNVAIGTITLQLQKEDRS